MYRVARLLEGLEGPGSVCEIPRPVVFLRGDVEPGGTVNLTDAVAILEFLFSGTVQLACVDAADANDDATVNISDAVALLNWLFAGGPPPAIPFPHPGFDPTDDTLGCEG